MGLETTPDGRQVWLPDDLSDEQKLKALENYIANTPLQFEEVVEEEVIETPDITLPLPFEVTEEEFIPPAGEPLTPEQLDNLRMQYNVGELGYEGGEWFGETTKAEGEDFWSLLGKSFTSARTVIEEWFPRGETTLDNLKEIAFQTEALENEAKTLREKVDTLTDAESLRLQEINKILHGSGKSDEEVRADIAKRITSLPPSFEPNIYGGADLTQFGIDVEKREEGLYKHLEKLGVESDRRSNALAEAELSNASKYIFTAGQGSWENTWDAFQDLSAPQKMDFMGDVVGMSGASTLLILLASFGTAGALRLAGYSGLTNFLGTGLATGAASYGVENVHSFYEYLKAEGLDVTDRNSIIETFNNEELIEEAEDYANTRGLIIGSIDGLTGGLATKIMAPTMVTRSTRGIMPYIYKPTGATLPRAGLRAVGDPVPPASRFAINFALQTPAQVTLPAGAEYFAQLATLEEGQLINFGEVLAEGIGEFAFVPADLALGAVATKQAYKNYSPKEESNRKVNKAVLRRVAQAKDKGLGHLAHKGDAVLDPQDADSTIRTTGIPFFERAWDIYNQYWDSIPTFAKSSKPNLIAPNQFYVGGDGQGGFQIKDSNNRKVGESFATEEEAAGVSGAFNIISHSRYTNEMVSGMLESLGIQDSEFGIELGSLLNDPYFNTVELGEIVTDDLKITNRAVFNRILDAAGRDTTTFDIQVIKKALSEKDFNILMKAKADSLSDRTRGVKSPTRVSRKMFENLKKKLNVNIDIKSDTFSRLSQRLTGESNYNKLSNAQKSFIYSFLSSLPAHEGDIISLPDLTSRTWLKEDYSRVVDSLFKGNPPTLNYIATVLGLDPNNINSKRTAARLRNDLISAGIINKRGTKYVLNKGGAWSLNRQTQQDLATDPDAQENLKQNLDYLEYLKKALVEMNIPELTLNVVPMLDNEIERAHSVRDDGVVGIFDPALRKIVLDVASAVRTAKDKSAGADVNWDDVFKELTKTLAHESWHGAVDMDMFAPSEKKNFLDSIKTKKISRSLVNEIFGDKTTFMKLRERLGRTPTYMDVAEVVYAGTTPDNIREEASAMLIEDIHEGKSKVVGLPRALANRFTKFLESIYRGFDEAGFQTTEDIYDKLISGEIGARTRTDITKPEVTVESYDEFGRPQETYQISRPASRTTLEMERHYQQTYYSMLSAATGQSVDTDDTFSDEADSVAPIPTRPLSDIPNLKFKLSEEQRRPTSLTSEFTLSARSGEYGNNLAHIPQVIFQKGIIGDPNMTRRFGRRVESNEVGATQSQLYQYTQENLAEKGFPAYPTPFRVYGVGDVDRSISTNVVTNNRSEAELMANGFVNPPFEIKGDRSKVTAYTIDRPSVVLNNAILFDGRIPAWAQAAYEGTEYLHVGSSRLITADSQEIEYESREPPTIPDKRIFTTGTGKVIPVPPHKPFPQVVRYKLSGLTGDLFDLSKDQSEVVYPLRELARPRMGSEIYSDVFNVFNQTPNRWQQSLDNIRIQTDNSELTRTQVDRSAREILDITQVSLDAFPQQIRVYRGGIQGGAVIESDEVVPVTLAPEVAKEFAFLRRDEVGRFSLQSWLIDKSEVLVNIDAFQPLGYWENELLVDADALRIAEETAVENNSLDYVDYTSPEQQERIRSKILLYENKNPEKAQQTLDTINFPLAFFPEARASEKLLKDLGEMVPRTKGLPQNEYRLPYGENFAEYMAQPEEKRRGKWITDRLRAYPTPASMIGQKDVKYKLAYPLTEQEFIKSKENLGQLLESGTPANELMEHPAIVEGERRMYSIPVTVEKYETKHGEDWVINTDYVNNREFIIDGKKTKGVGKVVDAISRKAESYADGRVGNNKRAWLFLGPPASGKSHFAELIATDENLAIIDSDDAKRFIPEYGEGVGAASVHREASMLTGIVRKRMLDEGKDILIPRIGGGRKRERTLDQMRELKQKGYTVNTVVMDVTQPLSQSRMYMRYIETGRLIDPQYMAEMFSGENSPLDTYHRLKYLGDGFAWIDNNGNFNQEIIRQDTGILPKTIGREPRALGKRLRETGETPIQEVISEDVSATRAVSIEEAIEGAKGINERLVSAGYTAKFNLNASADAIHIAYTQELTKDTITEIPNAIRKKYSLKGGKKLDEVAERLISRLTIRDEIPEDITIGESILRATEFFTIENLREQLVDQYAKFATSEAIAQRARGFGEEQLLASTSAISAAMFSDRSGEIWKGAFMEGIPVYDEKGYVRVEKLSPMDGKPVVPPMEFMRPLFRNPNNLWLWNAIRVVKRETRFDQEGRKIRITAQDKKDAKKILKENKWLNDVSEAYDRWDKHIVKFLVDTQVLDENTAKQWTQHADYFPFYRVLAIDEGDDVRTRGPQLFRGMHPFGKNIFIKAKGSETKKTLDPITAISQNLRAAIVLGMKNVAANRVMRNMIDAGQAEQVPLSSKDLKVVKTRVGGKNKAFRVLDRPLFEAFQNFADGQMPMGGFLSALAIPKRVVSESITRVPVFWAKQVLRDGLTAGSLLGTGVVSSVFRSMANAVRLANGKLLAQVPGVTEEMTLPEGYFKLRNAGVVTRYDQVIADYEDADKVVKEAYRQAGIRNLASVEGIKGLPFDILMGVWDLLGQGTIITDTSTRLVVYNRILKETGDEAEAIFQAMEILNFTRRGKNRLVQILATLLPFQNPRWQGMDVFARAYTGTYGKKVKGGKQLTKRERQTAVWFRTAMFMSLTPLYYMAVKDSDEYKEMSEEERELYWIIPGFKDWLGFTPRIPKPFELGLVFATLPEMLLRLMDEKETWRDVREAMWRQATGTLKLAPWEIQATKPAIEVAFNYDFFTGQPIVSERPSAPTDPKLQRRATTPNAYVEVGEALNMSPLQVQQIWEGYTGPYGAYIAMVADGLITNYVNPDAPTMPSTGWEKSLFIGGLVHPAESSGLVNEFYKLQDLTDEFLANSKALEDLIEVGDKRAYHYDDIYQLQYVDTVKDLKKELNKIAYLDKGQNLAEIRELQQLIINDNDRTPEEKREIILELKNLRNELLREARTLRVALEKGVFDQIEEFVEEKSKERERNR